MHYEIAVVGAGMFGSAAAKYLSQRGAKVLIVGPAEPVGPGAAVSQHSFGAHFDEARITRRIGWDPVWGTVDAQSLIRFQRIEADSEVGFFHERGSLIVMAKSIASRTSSILTQSQKQAIEVELLSEADLKVEFPYLCLPALCGGVEGLFERRMAGCLNPRQLVKAQLVLAQRAGATLERAAVRGIAKDSGSNTWRLQLDFAGRKEVAHANRVVIATGAFTNHNNVLPSDCKLSMRAFTEPNLMFELSARDQDRLASLPPIVTVDPADTGNDNMSIYLLPPVKYPDGKHYMRIGPGMQPFVKELHSAAEMTDWYGRQEATACQAQFLNRMWQVMLPGLAPVSVRHACCIIEKTPSRYPFIGPVDDDESLIVAVGGNGHGARGSDEIGRLAALVAAGERWDSPLDRAIFQPLIANGNPDSHSRPDFLKPPFGLC
jgi:sarcosine oxidase